MATDNSVALQLVSEVVEEIAQITVVTLVLLMLLLGVMVDEAHKRTFLSVGIVDGPRLQIVNRNDPLVSFLIRVATEEDISLALLFSFLIVEHRHTDHECRPLIAGLLALNDVVDERQLDKAHELVVSELGLLVVVPLQGELGQRHQSFLDILVDGIALLEKTVFEDDAAWVGVEAVLDAKDNKSGSSLD